MAGAFNLGKTEIMKGNVDWVNDTFRIMLMGTGYTFDPDDDHVSDIQANEISATSGYLRKDISGNSVTESDANNRADIDATDVTWTSLDTGGNDIKGAIIYKQTTTTYSIDAIDASTEKLTHNGADVTGDFPAGQTFPVSGSTDVPDGTYTVASSAFTGGNTEITVEEDITGSTADGTITVGDASASILIFWLDADTVESPNGADYRPEFAAPLATL